MAVEKVLIEHKDLKDTQSQPVSVSKVSYEKVWKDRGWRLHKTKKEND